MADKRCIHKVERNQVLEYLSLGSGWLFAGVEVHSDRCGPVLRDLELRGLLKLGFVPPISLRLPHYEVYQLCSLQRLKRQVLTSFVRELHECRAILDEGDLVNLGKRNTSLDNESVSAEAEEGLLSHECYLLRLLYLGVEAVHVIREDLRGELFS
jgi:hypothetical protein